MKRIWARCVGLLLVVGTVGGCATQTSQIEQAKTVYVTIDPGVVEDAVLSELVGSYTIQLDEQMNEVIGTAAEDLNNNSGTVEFALGNFVADLMLTASIKRFGEPVDLALINARGGLRVPISKGDITVGNVFELMPFDNEVWILQLTGEETQMFFDHCTLTEKMSVAGARYEMNGKSAVAIQIGGDPFQSEKTYLLAVPDFLATGGDGFDFLPDARRVEKLNYLVRDMIIDHIRALNEQSMPVDARLDGRVIERP
jgi:2',3'-cyclic-nucleotide 2'-phosphodiesterase (5'-nucleotidase family)